MPATAVIRVEKQREEADCGLVSLSMYLGVSYEDVLRAVTVADRKQGREGLWSRTMQRTAEILGHKLRKRKRIDLESDYGILRLPTHAAVLRNGLIVNSDGTIWEVEAFLEAENVTVEDCELLVAVE